MIGNKGRRVYCLPLFFIVSRYCGYFDKWVLHTKLPFFLFCFTFISINYFTRNFPWKFIQNWGDNLIPHKRNIIVPLILSIAHLVKKQGCFMLSNLQHLELTWMGKENRSHLEPRIFREYPAKAIMPNAPIPPQHKETQCC